MFSRGCVSSIKRRAHLADRRLAGQSPVIHKPASLSPPSLNERDKRDENDHHRGLETLIAIADREIAEGACADHAGRHRGANEKHHSHG